MATQRFENLREIHVSLYIHLVIQLPKQRGIYVEIENPNSTLTTQGIIDRIIENRFV